VAHTAGVIWLSYKLPEYTRKLLRRPPADRATMSRRHERTAERILRLALSMRGVMIKMCQAIATRADIFPREFVERLKQCHDAVPAKPFDVIRGVIEEDLGKPLDAIFLEFDPTPIAAASLAQVHLARLADGREVAVKVQYPDIEDIIRTDLRNMQRVCRVYEFFDPQPLELLPLLQEVTTHLGYELDFEREAACGRRVRELFADDPQVQIPEVYEEWSGTRTLVMERVEGIKVTERQALIEAGLDPANVVQDLMHIYVRMILAAGFFQADPHPGNLFVTPEGRIIVIDFGLSKELPRASGWGCSS